MTRSRGYASKWEPLRRELAAWEQNHVAARLWLRDDDAVSVTPALVRLTERCAEHDVPYLIAVIPSQADTDLANYLSQQPLAEIAAHGWTHRNHGGLGCKAEFPEQRSRVEIVRDLRRARDRMEALFGSGALPIYVPPWNRMAAEVANLLPVAGFETLSVIGRNRIAGLYGELGQINVHLDIIDWRGSRGGRDHKELVDELAAHLAWARENDQSPIGILTHHLVHDERAWTFLQELFAETAHHLVVRWSRVTDLLASQV